MSEPTRYDLWLTEVTDPRLAMEALTEALGDRARAREAVLSTPAMLLHGAAPEEMQALSTRLSSAGLTLEARPSRRAATTPPAASLTDAATAPDAASSAHSPTRGVVAVPRAAAAGEGVPGSPSGSATHGTAPRSAAAPASDGPAATPRVPRPAHATTANDMGVAKVSYYAALVAAPAFLLQPAVVSTVLGLSVLSFMSMFGAVTGSITIAFGAPMAVYLLRFAAFALVVRRSHVGQADLRLGSEDLGELWFAGFRFLIVSFLALVPALVVLWSFGPAPTHGADAGVVALFVLAVLLPLVALPGAFAAAALGKGCSGVNPFIGLIVARRIPVPYFVTLAYLSAFWFVSVALAASGGMLTVFGLVDPDAGLVGALGGALLMSAIGLVVDVGSMMVSARILGLLTHHYSEELGL
ncbi:MAG: hypothetical protein H6726_17930 [Sandaracinaceae bacterium]|nr:hypothetical protein [Sandaracinaceae bacterium]